MEEGFTMRKKTESQHKPKLDRAALTVIIVLAAAVVVFVVMIALTAPSAANPPTDPEITQTAAGTSSTEDRYTLMKRADGTENFPMNVKEEIGAEYVHHVEFQYAEPQPGLHCVRTLFYLGEEDEKYGGYGELWVNSEYEDEENPLLLPGVADYDPLEDMGLSLSDLFAQAKIDPYRLPDGTFYWVDTPGSIGVKASYGQNTIIYFYTEEKGKAAAVMYDWGTTLTHVAFYE